MSSNVNHQQNTQDSTAVAVWDALWHVISHLFYGLGRHTKRHPRFMLPSLLYGCFVLAGGHWHDLVIPPPHTLAALFTRWHHEPRWLFIIAGILVIVHVAWYTWEEVNYIPSHPERIKQALKQAGLWESTRYQPPRVVKKMDRPNSLELVMTADVPQAVWESDAVQLPFCGALGVKRFDRVYTDEHGGVHLTLSRGSFPQKELTQKERNHAGIRQLVIGYSRYGRIVIRYDDRPHFLIGGSTGSGKSVLVGHVLLQILDARMLAFLIDPKGGLDYEEWEDKLAAPIATSVEDALPILQALWELHLSRRGQLKSWHLKNWAQALERGKTIEQDQWLIIDEYAIFSSDTKDKTKKETSQQAQTIIQNLAMGARATGIHLVIVTQYPTSELLGNQLRQQLTPIAGRLETDVASRTVLGEAGAEQLPGKGRFLIRQPEGLIEFQGFLP
jgi:S-DNA-T family DNA segregation ATPase FtsK/SpoIIIE